MPKRSLRIPAYRLHKPTGQAVVRIDGHDHYLGKHDSDLSHEKYHRLIAEWLASGARPGRTTTGSTPSVSLTVAELMLAYWEHAKLHYRSSDGTPTRELDNMRDALRPLRRLYGSTDALSFGPKALKSIQADLVASGLSRGVVNARIDRIRRVFKWGVAAELLPAGSLQSLQAVAGLQRGRTLAKEAPGIRPVPIEHVEAALPFMPKPVAAMVRFQLYTGCRPGEVTILRGSDIRPGDSNVTYRPSSHKTAWRGRERVIAVGPRALDVLKPFLRDDPMSYLFDPREASRAESERRVRLGKAHRPSRHAGTSRETKPGRRPGEKYTQYSYRQAIQRAGVPAWCPLQLRHTAATAIRARFGLEAAQTVLGHAKADVTQVYAERDLAKARDVMAEMG
jgi:integrase